MKIFFASLIGCLVFTNQSFAQNEAETLIGKSTMIRIISTSTQVEAIITTPTPGFHQTIKIETDKQSTAKLDDYNFDGTEDISISYMDEGMGTFLVSKIYTYSNIEHQFIEQHPACGDEFLNLRIDSKNKSLISTYFKDNTPHLCSTRLEK